MEPQNQIEANSAPVERRRASLIISTWNGRRLLETCLPNVLRAVQQSGGDHEVIVVDDASTDDTVEFVRREFPAVRLLALARNLRFAGANNAAARLARGEVLVFLNNDMLVAPDFLNPLLRHFGDPDVFAVTARIHMAARRVGGHEVSETGLVRGRFEEGSFVLRHEQPMSQAPARVIYAGGGSSAWRRDRFLALGGFDRLFRPFYFEDLDVSYRAQKLGWSVLFEPRSLLEHKHRQTNNPDNFPGAYVDLTFGKNYLLFMWKALTDSELLHQHFRGLWRRLMSPRADPRLTASFMRATVQLPELLIKRHRARRAGMLSDREVFRRAGADPAREADDAGSLPYGSTGRGKRLLVLGSAPLPFEDEAAECAACARTWHLTQALLQDGHQVTLVGCSTTRASRAPVVRFTGRHFTYYRVAREFFEQGETLQRICDQARPEMVVGVHAHGAWAAARLHSQAPLWADLSDSAMAAAQAQAADTGEEGATERAWRWERSALAAADAFSVATARQKYVLAGELAAQGRLGAAGYGEDIIHYLPEAAEEPHPRRADVLRGRLVAEDDFVIVWRGGGFPAADVGTLFEGVTAAMREETRIKLVCLSGGRWDEHGAVQDLRRRAEDSPYADRFVFVHDLPAQAMPGCYVESDVGVAVERASYAMLTGSGHATIEMLAAGIPVIVTEGTELASLAGAERFGLTCAPESAEALKQAVLKLCRDESLRRRCAARAREYVAGHRRIATVMAPLLRWARSPQRARGGRGGPSLAQAAPRGRTALGRVAETWEAQGRRAALAATTREILRGMGGLALGAFALRRRARRDEQLAKGPVARVLVIRAAALSTTRAVTQRVRRMHAEAEVSVLAPAALAEETAGAIWEAIIAAPGAGAVSYRISPGLIRRLRGERFDTVLVAGEGNHRAELIALLLPARRRTVVSADGSCYTLRFAVYKPLLLAVRLLAGALEKLTVSGLLLLVRAAITAEGWVWQLRRRRGAAGAGQM